ncbi:hypothetical protein [Clostridium senegalense]|uniref:hypothetical protein n=1 Tax=Clostridium senegalense TaxID=1465809 RepID=UPI0002897997|nr:hypothetical protein [Clostridium senegalense]MBU5226108.1 hypothetical protein [Clostridium senegalense]
MRCNNGMGLFLLLLVIVILNQGNLLNTNCRDGRSTMTIILLVWLWMCFCGRSSNNVAYSPYRTICCC